MGTRRGKAVHLFLFITFLVSGGFAHTETPRRAATTMGVETAMLKAGLPAKNTSVLVGETTWRSDASGTIQRHGSLEWRTLNGEAVIPKSTDQHPTRNQFCHTAPGHDPVPGNREVHFVTGADADYPSTLVLGTTPTNEVLIVDLKPGETLSVLTVTHIQSGKTKERISLDRSDEVLYLRRHGSGAEACFTYPS